jgi:hypothetical protein
LIIAIFRSIVYGIVAVIENVTPEWTSIQRSMAILATAALLVFWWYRGRPMMKKIENQRRYKEDQNLIKKVYDYVNQLSISKADHSLIRCWSCFKEIVRTENFCEHCGTAQN